MGLPPSHEHIAASAARSLVLVTPLNPPIGYGKVVKTGKVVLAENTTLKQAAEQLCCVRPEDFDRRVVPTDTTVPSATLPGGGC